MPAETIVVVAQDEETNLCVCVCVCARARFICKYLVTLLFMLELSKESKGRTLTLRLAVTLPLEMGVCES